MRIFKCILLGGMLLLSSSAALAQVSLSQNSSGSNVFSLVGKKDKACVYYDAKDFEVVKTTAGLFANDVKEVSGQLLGVATTKEAPQKNCIIIGTLGHNEWIDQMVAKKKLDVEPLKNRWESYLVQLVRNPLPGVDKALVIVGSDRRGTAYGLLSVSRTIGVSPWYWWADAPIIKKDQLHLRVDKYISKEPTVKYRGIFINDEDWDFTVGQEITSRKNWAISVLGLMPKFVSFCFGFRPTICVRLCTMHLWHSTGFRRTGWLQTALLSLWELPTANRYYLIRQVNGNAIRWANGITSIIKKV